jgi:GGDEF domain-containing protein
MDRRLGPEGAGRTLRAVGDWLQRQCRSTDIVLYRGAGQFGVILPDTSPELVDVVAHRIVDRPDGAAEVALLVGSASFPHDGRDPDDLMRVAAGRLISLAAPPDTGMISERPSTADSGGVTQ